MSMRYTSYIILGLGFLPVKAAYLCNLVTKTIASQFTDGGNKPFPNDKSLSQLNA